MGHRPTVSTVGQLIREVDMTYGTPNTIEGQAAAELFAMQFPVDLRESTEAYQCAMDVPGMAKADIKVCFSLKTSLGQQNPAE